MADTSVNGEVERVVAAARDALTDDIVTRVSATLVQGLELLDRVNRSGLDRALPTIARLAENGDLDRLANVARLVAAMEDSLNEDIIVRLGATVTGLAMLADKVARNDGLLKLIDLLGRDDVQKALPKLLDAMSKASAESAARPPASGGLGALWQLATDPGTQEALRLVALMGKHLRAR
ncbi:MAG: hypothetical protein ACOYXU_10215 [Nitrospirota bacterium]